MTIYDHLHHGHTDQAPVAGQEQEALPPLQTIEDPARNAGSSSINTLDTQPSFLHRHLREAGVFAVGVLAATGGLLAFNKVQQGSEEQFTPKNPTAPSVLPPQASQAPTSVETSPPSTEATPTTLEERFAPGTNKLIKTADGYDINYSAFPSFSERYLSPVAIEEQAKNSDLIDYGKKADAETIQPALSAGKRLPKAIGECVVFKEFGMRENKPVAYYTVLVNPTKIEDRNNKSKTTYYTTSGGADYPLGVEQLSDGNYRVPFGIQEFSVINLEGSRTFPLVAEFERDGHPIEPNPDIWQETGHVAYTASSSDKSSVAVVDGMVTITGPDNLQLDESQKLDLCTDIFEQTNISSLLSE